MSIIFISALRLSETEQLLQYPKFALIAFFAAFALRATLAARHERQNNWLLIPAVLWACLTALILFIGFRAWEWGYYGGAASAGVLLGFVPWKSSVAARFSLLAQPLGIVALLGALMMVAVGALP